jgi:hypothetical protein
VVLGILTCDHRLWLMVLIFPRRQKEHFEGPLKPWKYFQKLLAMILNLFVAMRILPTALTLTHNHENICKYMTRNLR